MPLYSYRAVDSSGRRLEGTLAAASEAEVRTALRGKGLYPLSLRTGEGTGGAAWRDRLTFDRVGLKDILLFTQQLGGLLKAGVPVDRAFGILGELAEKRSLRLILTEILEDVQAGRALSEAMRKHSVFPPFYVNMIMAGEAGGVLDAVVERLATFLESSIGFREEIRTALIYPMLLTLMAGGAVAVLVLFVLPRFALLFEDMGQSLPLVTVWILTVSDFARNYWWAGLILAAGGVGLLKAYRQTDEGQIALDELRLRVPVVRELSIKVAVARFSRTLGTLLQSGVPIIRAVAISREVLGNEYLARTLLAVEEGLSKGRGLAAPLRETSVFPRLVSHMVSVGEEAGRLEETLLLIAERFEQESRVLLKRLLGLLEPAIIFIMAGLVGFVVLAMVFTIFSVNDIPL